MRHETCMNCKIGAPNNPKLQNAIITTRFSESHGLPVHHHHVRHCDNCGKSWLDDLKVNPLGVPITDESGWCECDESKEYFRPAIVHIPGIEEECRCTNADVEQWKENMLSL